MLYMYNVVHHHFPGCVHEQGVKWSKQHVNGSHQSGGLPYLYMYNSLQIEHLDCCSMQFSALILSLPINFNDYSYAYMYINFACFFVCIQKAFHSVDDLLEAAAEQEKLEPPAKKISHSSAENLTTVKSKAPPPAPLKRPPKTAPKTPQKKGEQLV